MLKRPPLTYTISINELTDSLVAGPPGVVVPEAGLLGGTGRPSVSETAGGFVLQAENVTAKKTQRARTAEYVFIDFKGEYLIISIL